jgi:hypothetical protein
MNKKFSSIEIKEYLIKNKLPRYQDQKTVEKIKISLENILNDKLKQMSKKITEDFIRKNYPIQT